MKWAILLLFCNAAMAVCTDQKGVGQANVPDIIACPAITDDLIKYKDLDGRTYTIDSDGKWSSDNEK